MVLLVQGIFGQNQYILDKYHSSLGFTTTHFGISHVSGNFKNFEVTLVSGKNDFTDASITMNAETKSIDTGVEMRDKDLRSEGWFDAEKYPTLEFVSTSFKKMTDKTYKLEGNITIHGVTKPISFDVTYNGKAMNPMTKKNFVNFTVTGKLNRKDFKIGSESMESVVGKEIELRSDVDFTVTEKGLTAK